MRLCGRGVVRNALSYWLDVACSPCTSSYLSDPVFLYFALLHHPYSNPGVFVTFFRSCCAFSVVVSWVIAPCMITGLVAPWISVRCPLRLFVRSVFILICIMVCASCVCMCFLAMCCLGGGLCFVITRCIMFLLFSALSFSFDTFPDFLYGYIL